jgi:hypothetical protein
MANITTMPRAFNIVKSGDNYSYKPSNILTGEPKLETSPVQKVTYNISSKAKWNDGTPVTSADFEYTWDQIKNGTDIYDQTGYKQIASVDASNPQVSPATGSPSSNKSRASRARRLGGITSGDIAVIAGPSGPLPRSGWDREQAPLILN